MQAEEGRKPKAIIPQETMLLRLEQSEDLRDFTIQMWLRNPLLARQGGTRVMELLKPLQESIAR
jgi:hypothetical protein